MSALGETLLKELADAIVLNGMRDAGYKYFNLDDGWQNFSRQTNG